jgi:hypothetical protein
MKVVNILEKPTKANISNFDWPLLRKTLLQALIENYEWGLYTTKKKDGFKVHTFSFFKTLKGLNAIQKENNSHSFNVYKVISKPQLALYPTNKESNNQPIIYINNEIV